MPRIARTVIPGIPHHVTQRGNNRQDVFFVEDDREVYLQFLADYSRRHGLDVLGYCLMTNHIHLVAVPRRADSLARAVGSADFRYTQYVNRLHGRLGHLWQNRFYSSPLDEKHAVAALRYVEQNPVRAGMVRAPWRYRWSSASAHVGGRAESELLDLDAWRKTWKDETGARCCGRRSTTRWLIRFDATPCAGVRWDRTASSAGSNTSSAGG